MERIRVRTPEQKVREYAQKKLRRESDPAVRQREAENARRYRLEKPEPYVRGRKNYLAKKKGDGRPRVYFIQATSGPIKIGFTTKTPEGRLAEMQAGNHEELTLLGSFLAPMEQEAELHARFKRLCIRGEWFHPAPELLGTITALCVAICPLAQSQPS